jgi:hypothetical protein
MYKSEQQRTRANSEQKQTETRSAAAEFLTRQLIFFAIDQIHHNIIIVLIYIYIIQYFFTKKSQ